MKPVILSLCIQDDDIVSSSWTVTMDLSAYIQLFIKQATPSLYLPFDNLLFIRPIVKMHVGLFAMPLLYCFMYVLTPLRIVRFHLSFPPCYSLLHYLRCFTIIAPGFLFVSNYCVDSALHCCKIFYPANCFVGTISCFFFFFANIVLILSSGLII